MRFGKGVQIIPARLIAACFALTVFAGAIVVGLVVGNEPMRVLGRAMLLMVICWGTGRLLGAMAARIVEDYLQAFRDAHPLPEEEEAEIASVDRAMGSGTGESIVAPVAAAETRRMAA